ncbi:MAG: hypothetical protein ACREWG_11520 [Gammaproteobacteria bacterium]
MRTTVELSDELFRRAKAEAALRGRKFKDLVEEGLRRVLESPEPEKSAAGETKPPTLHDLMKDCCGMVNSGVSDLATNPDHMKDFGRDSMGDR